MVFIPTDVYKTIAAAQKGQITQEEAYAKVTEIITKSQLNDIAAIIAEIITILLFAMVLFIAFLVVREVCPKSIVKQIVVFVIFLAIWLVLASIAAKI
jgi:ABC-type sugar transport system substrate-binding protein